MDLEILLHKAMEKLFPCFWSYNLLFFLYFFYPGNQSRKKMVYKQNALWRVRSGDKTTECVSIASFPGSPRTPTKNRKERGEPGKIYHMRNIVSRENLITCGWTNELAHAAWTYSHSIVIAFLYGRPRQHYMLHYLAVRKAMVSVHRPVHLKITLTTHLPGKLTAVHPGEWFSRHH